MEEPTVPAGLWLLFGSMRFLFGEISRKSPPEWDAGVRSISACVTDCSNCWGDEFKKKRSAFFSSLHHRDKRAFSISGCAAVLPFYCQWPHKSGDSRSLSTLSFVSDSSVDHDHNPIRLAPLGQPLMEQSSVGTSSCFSSSLLSFPGFNIHHVAPAATSSSSTSC